jgi:hypothetical protein
MEDQSKKCRCIQPDLGYLLINGTRMWNLSVILGYFQKSKADLQGSP